MPNTIKHDLDPEFLQMAVKGFTDVWNAIAPDMAEAFAEEKTTAITSRELVDLCVDHLDFASDCNDEAAFLLLCEQAGGWSNLRIILADAMPHELWAV